MRPRGPNVLHDDSMSRAQLLRLPSDATHGSSHLLLASTMATESLPALAKVVEPRSGRAILRCRPVEPVGRQPFVQAIGHARTSEHSIESRGATDRDPIAQAAAEARLMRATCLHRAAMRPANGRRTASAGASLRVLVTL